MQQCCGVPTRQGHVRGELSPYPFVQKLLLPVYAALHVSLFLLLAFFRIPCRECEKSHNERHMFTSLFNIHFPILVLIGCPAQCSVAESLNPTDRPSYGTTAVWNEIPTSIDAVN